MTVIVTLSEISLLFFLICLWLLLLVSCQRTFLHTGLIFPAFNLLFPLIRWFPLWPQGLIHPLCFWWSFVAICVFIIKEILEEINENIVLFERSYVYIVNFLNIFYTVIVHFSSKTFTWQWKNVFAMCKGPFVKFDLFYETVTIISWFKCQSPIIR